MKNLRFVPIPLMCLTVLSSIGLAHAAPGDLDTTFATTGKKTRNINQQDQGRAVAVQSDGKIVTAGISTVSTSVSDFSVYRVNSNGTDDTTFGTSGVVTVNFQSGGTLSSDYCQTLAIQSDGKILVAGSVENNSTAGNAFGVARLNTNGTLDTTFGTGGKVILNPTSGEEYAQSIAVQSDGKILVGGYAYVYNGSTTTRDFVLTRLSSAGVTDTTFGSSGVSIVNFGADDIPYKVLIQSDGKILMTGWTATNTTQKFAAVRFTTAGAIDTSYGVAGKATVSFGPSIQAGAYAAALQSNNYLVLGGGAYDGSQSYAAMTRLTTSGTVDTSFSSNSSGLLTVNFGGGSINGLALQSDGKIVIVGTAYDTSGNGNGAIARMNSNGTVDGTFASTFPVSTPWSSYATYSAVAIQTNGKIVVAGSNGLGTAGDFAVARYVGSTPPSASPSASPSGGAA